MNWQFMPGSNLPAGATLQFTIPDLLVTPPTTVSCTQILPTAAVLACSYTTSALGYITGVTVTNPCSSSPC